jgi:ABC-type oligopeptide transport system substrate-binding subunit
LPREYWEDDSINKEDWHNHMGSGPFWPTDVVEGSHVTYDKNPNYWQTDPFHPENRVSR